MSKESIKNQNPSDQNVVQRLQQEIARNTQEMTYNFWQEYELMRNIQRQRLSHGSEMRQRITNMVRALDNENNQQAEAISRSISIHGMTTLDSTMSQTPPARSLSLTRSADEGHRIITPEIRQQLRNSLVVAATSPSGSQPAPEPRNQRRRLKNKALPKLKSNASQSPTVSLNIPQAPPTSRATIVSAVNSRFASNQTTPHISKYQLNKKPKK